MLCAHTHWNGTRSGMLLISMENRVYFAFIKKGKKKEEEEERKKGSPMTS